jgi:hypothetical protein
MSEIRQRYTRYRRDRRSYRFTCFMRFRCFTNSLVRYVQEGR